VLDRKNKKDISQEPEMIRLKALFSSMTPEEQTRTIEYIKGKETGNE